jgi:indole-3-glycerol phosphate synthase
MDLVETREMIACPVIRRDFILDQYQVIEAKAMGADAIQLMAVILTPFEVERLAAIAQVLGLEVILEVRSRKELETSFNRNIDIVSINNRRASDLKLDLETSFLLAAYIPDQAIKISEGGIKTPEDVRRLGDAGFQGYLIGERFMQEENPSEACKIFIENLRNKPTNVTR